MTCGLVRRIALAAAFVCAVIAPSFGETVVERAAPCLACHGESGQSETPDVPSLGGQPAPYLLIQLYLFREQQRVSPARKNDQMIQVMFEMTRGFTDDDLRSFSDLLAKLPPPARRQWRYGAHAAGGRPDHAESMQQLSRSRSDRTRQRPRIAAQREDYLVKTMREYKSNDRRGYDAAMADVLASVSDQQIADLAYYIARFR
jgi:cytochrome c553